MGCPRPTSRFMAPLIHDRKSANKNDCVDLLASVGETLNDRDHISVIFKGLPSEYDTFIISSNTRIEGYTVAEIEALLLASESRIEKTDQKHEITANLAKTDSDYIFDQDQDLNLEANVA
uniref:Retrovirus-related Pol polyprotein from transposon TNT 1-94 n=1 Tax=Cannabis sativa TaxID=3483 RepID=A0A803NFV9_CANSA